MTTWTSHELDKIGNAEELQIAPLRADGTLRKPVIIWVVRVGDDLYVRSYKGRTAHWFRGVLVRHAGQIRAGGLEKAVAFVEETDPAINAQIDAAYLSKYRHSPYASSMVTPAVRVTTIKLVAQVG